MLTAVLAWLICNAILLLLMIAAPRVANVMLFGPVFLVILVVALVAVPLYHLRGRFL